MAQRSWWWGVAPAVVAVACSAGGGGGFKDQPVQGGGSTGGGGAGSGLPGLSDGGSAGAAGSAGGGFIDLGPGSGSGPETADAACKSVKQQAERTRGGKADIVWVLDNSLSMVNEALAVQTKLNEFANFITSSGIDAHVVVVASCELPPLGQPAPPGTDLLNAVGVSIGAPLGSGQACPNDSNPPPAGAFLHVFQSVDSHNALDRLMTTYPQWQGMIRPDSTKTLVVVTDDEANAAPSAADFSGFFSQQFAGSVWRFSGVFCVPGQDATGCSNPGATYAALVAQTGGVQTNLPQANWDAVFQELGDAVLADAKPVDCEWVIPPPPDGEEFAPNKVNVRFQPSTGDAVPVYAVASPGDCTQDFLGWYYDDPNAPTRVVSCPQTCPTLQADTGASIEVLFGCATEPPPVR